VAELAAQGARARAWAADVRDRARASEVVAEVVATLGGPDALVCCAGVTADATVFRMRETDWETVVGVNLTGTFHWNQAVAPLLRDRKFGRIVNVASINGLRGKFGQANYAASKGGVIALSKSLARELGKFGVTVNVVAPGMVLTDMTRALPPDVIERAREETVLGRLAEPADCADAIAFLCSRRAGHITGEVVRVDGGQAI
jgi:NAD(P)-dependent dehydrogenase (short-subunit alcohol dehydrogenase family)